MPLTWCTDPTTLDWPALVTLYRRAPLGDKSEAHLRTVYGNIRFHLFVHEGSELVAAGRVLSDGADCAYICDVAVLPEHQGSGLGRELVARLLQTCRGHKKIILYAVPGKEGFYRRLGFRPMLTAMAVFEHEAEAIARGYLAGDAA